MTAAVIKTQISSELSAEKCARWEEFRRDCAHPSYQQTLHWVQAMEEKGNHRFSFATTTHDDEVVATAVIRHTRLAGPYWLATSQRGPLIKAAENFSKVLASMAAELKLLGATTWQFAPRACDRAVPQLAAACREIGAKPLAMHRQPIHVATGIVDLTREEDEIAGDFSQSTRRKLRQASRGGITVREVASDEDLAEFQRCMDLFASSRPDYDDGNQPSAIRQRHLVKALGGAMLLAEHEGQVVSCASYLHNGDEAVWLTLANSGERPNLPANYILLWEKMRRARSAGQTVFDMAGIPLDDLNATPGERGRQQFKNAFRPQRRLLMPMQMLPLRTVPHSVLYPLRQTIRELVR